MNRRRLLTLVGAAALGGCLDGRAADFVDGSATKTGSTPSSGPSSQANGQTLRRVAVESSDGVSRNGVTASVAVLEPSVTTVHTARLRIALTNEGDNPIEVESGRRKGFGAFYSEGDAPNLLLASADWSLEKADESCWRPQGRVQPSDVVASYRLDSGESVSLDVEVWDARSNEGACLPTGTYRFEHEYWLGPDESSSEFTWGFDLGVERP